MSTVLTESDIQAHAAVLQRLVGAVEKVIVGQRSLVEGLVIGLLCNGHVLVEGLPGLAKTLTVSCLARAIHARFARVQFTPDLLPADLVGTLIYQPRDGTFTPRKGPIFANIVLADEINRAPAKVQSALLEAMQERQVTIGDASHALPQPFLVLATMNPIEQEGTYSLPEAQVDRFLLKLRVGYPSKEEERQIVGRMASSSPEVAIERVIDLDEVLAARRAVDQVHVDPRITDYAIDLVRATRLSGGEPSKLKGLVEYGASPRASIAAIMASKARAFLDGRGYVTPADVKAVAPDVLRHRVILGYEAEAEGVDADEVVRRVLASVAAP